MEKNIRPIPYDQNDRGGTPTWQEVIRNLNDKPAEEPAQSQRVADTGRQKVENSRPFGGKAAEEIV